MFIRVSSCEIKEGTRFMNSFPFKLAAIDIDDTLVGHDKRIGLANRASVARLLELGCRVVLASGRRHDNMLPYHVELGLDPDAFLVSCQGAVAKNAARCDVLHQALVAPADAEEVTIEGLARGLTVLHWGADGVFAHRRTPWVDRYEADCRDPVTVADLRGLAGRPAEKVVWGGDPDVIAPLAREMGVRFGPRLELTVTDDWFLEFTAPAATKAAGVAAVARHYGVEPRRVLAFGDGNNDVPLLAWAGLGVAMSHARPSARAAARLVAPAGDPESSLARAVEGVLAAVGACAGNATDGTDRFGRAA
jgi:Cof subfamily protein (haloacid dehalogenase superfamily)